MLAVPLSHRVLSWMVRHSVRGWTRWAHALGIDQGSSRGLRQRNRYGALLELDPWDYIDRFVVTEGFYESEVFDAIAEALPESGGVFWDVGANRGHHAVTLKSLRPDVQVLAFEPSPREIAGLMRNALLNQVDIWVLPLALHQRAGLLTFHVCNGNTGRNTLQDWGDTSEFSKRLASCVQADVLCREHDLPVPNVVKIDVECAELDVLLGMQEILRHPQCRRIILEAGADTATSDNPIRSLLESCGYHLHALQRRESTTHDLENFVAQK